MTKAAAAATNRRRPITAAPFCVAAPPSDRRTKIRIFEQPWHTENIYRLETREIFRHQNFYMKNFEIERKNFRAAQQQQKKKNFRHFFNPFSVFDLFQGIFWLRAHSILSVIILSYNFLTLFLNWEVFLFVRYELMSRHSIADEKTLFWNHTPTQKMSLNFDPLTLNLVRGRRSHFVFGATFRNFWRSNTQLRKASNSQNPVPDDDSSSMSSIGWAPWFFAGRIWHYRGAIISGADARCQKSTLPKMNLVGNKLPTNSGFDDVRFWHSASVASFPFQMECFQWHYLFSRQK